MRQKITCIFFFISLLTNAQNIDFGIEFRNNVNLLSNKYNQSKDFSSPGHQTNELGSFQIPAYNFGFLDDNGDQVFVRFNEVKMDNNVELPIFIKYSTEKDFYFDLKVSGGKYRIEYQGRLFRDADYYLNQYGSFDDYVNNYGGNLDGEPVNGDPDNTYTDERAYINWFDDQVNSDPYSQANAMFVEEVKYRSIHLWVGKKFLAYKRVQPFVNVGLHYRTAVSSFKRKHFEIDDNYLGYVLTKKDLSDLSTEIPNFSKNALGLGFRLGFDIYRYHFAVATDYSFSLNTKHKNESLVFDYSPVGAGFGTFSLELGIDLFTYDFKTKNNRDIIYGAEFQTLTSRLDKNRLLSLGVYIKSPVHSRMNNGKTFSLVNIKDSPNPNAGKVDLNWESLSFSKIERVNWSPKIELGLRYNVIKPIDIELTAAVSVVNIDTKVQALNTKLIYNSSDNQYEFDPFNSSANYAVYRSTFAPLALGSNVYFKLINKDAFDVRVYAGAAVNWFAVVTPDAKSEFGINGVGNDIYQTTEDVLFYGDYEPTSIHNVATSYYSNYANPVDLNRPASEMLNNYEGAGMYPLGTYQFNRSTIYPTVNLGLEMEFNRFLCGFSGEFSILTVDNLLVDSYYNLSLNVGYIIQTKNRINSKLKY